MKYEPNWEQWKREALPADQGGAEIFAREYRKACGKDALLKHYLGIVTKTTRVVEHESWKERQTGRDREPGQEG